MFSIDFVSLCSDVLRVCIIELDNDENGSLDRIGQLITDLIMWKDAAKSSLWFGFGSLFFLSSCFARGVSFRSGFLAIVHSFVRVYDRLIAVLILIITAFSRRFPSLDFCFWVLHLSPIQSVKGTLSNLIFNHIKTPSILLSLLR